MQSFFGAPLQLVKFLSLAMGLLLLAAAVGCIFFGHVLLAVCCAVVGAYALMLFFDALKAEIIEAIRDRE